MKSHGEKLIANTLFEHGVVYGYERNRRWNGVNYRPDFTVAHPDGGGVVIEYFGLQGDPDYDEQAQAKRTYWSTQPTWRLIEYSPRDLAAGNEAFAERLVADLSDWTKRTSGSSFAAERSIASPAQFAPSSHAAESAGYPTSNSRSSSNPMSLSRPPRMRF